MTERGGGSDVGTGTETVARLQPDGSFKLFGFKWFSSATDCNMTIALARYVSHVIICVSYGRTLSFLILAGSLHTCTELRAKMGSQ
jgi:alkylation response protein AidB-like acyl-CoA dehydrogenase